MPPFDVFMDADLVPQQPGLAGRMRNVVSTVELWNPACKKNLAYIFQFETGPGDATVEILPDNCVDFVFVCNDNPKAYLSGSTTSVVEETLEPDSTYFVFKPYSLLGADLSRLAVKELHGQRLPLELIFKDLSIIETINRAAGFPERVSLFMEYAKKHLINPGYNDPFVEHLELMICRRRGQDKINNIADKLGYTDRYCRSRFKDSLGLSLKTYSDIIRVQNVVRMLSRSRPSGIFDVAFENKYYDQSHLIHMFKKYTKYTPNEFVRKFAPGAEKNPGGPDRRRAPGR